MPPGDGGLCVNDDYANNVPSDGTGSAGNWVTVGTFDEVTSIHSFRGREGYADGGMNTAAYRVNGRILVDGPANNSRVWSNSSRTFTGGSEAPFDQQPLTAAFDGKTSATSPLALVLSGQQIMALQKCLHLIRQFLLVLASDCLFSLQAPSVTGVILGSIMCRNLQRKNNNGMTQG